MDRIGMKAKALEEFLSSNRLFRDDIWMIKGQSLVGELPELWFIPNWIYSELGI